LPDRRSALLLEVKIKIFATLSENKPINNNSKKKVNCETDFVARNTLFQSFVKGLLASAAQNTVIKNSGDVQEGAAVDSILQTQ
jgi:translation elongation factor EF-Ts